MFEKKTAEPAFPIKPPGSSAAARRQTTQVPASASLTQPKEPEVTKIE
jgi:hypothetical protein